MDVDSRLIGIREDFRGLARYRARPKLLTF
jgi:hypothetical protein